MKRLDFICHTLQALCAACLLVQISVDFSYENIIPVFMAVAGLSIFIQYMRISRPFDDSPISSLALFGYSMTALYVSLVAQTMSLQPLVRYLRAPLETFSTLTIILLIGTSVHYIHRKFQPFRLSSDKIGNFLLTPLGIHDVPKPLALWLISPLGYIALLKGGANIGDVSGKFVQALSFTIWLPFLIPAYYRQYGEAYCRLNKQIPLLIAHILMVVGVGVAINARQVMFIGPVTVGLLYFMVAVRENTPMPQKSVIKISVAIAMGLAGTILAANLVTGMEIAREKREHATFTEMIEETFRASADPVKLQQYRERSRMQSFFSLYDENYLENPLLGRLSETKFHDNMIYFSGTFNESQREVVLEETIFKIIATLPQPVLDALEIKVNKSTIAFSMGDIYREQISGDGVGSYNTGSVWGDVLTLSGPYWPFATALLCLVTFILLDTLTLQREILYMAAPGLCLSWTLFIYGVGSESLAAKFLFLFRLLPEKIFLFSILLALTKIPFKNVIFLKAPRRH